VSKSKNGGGNWSAFNTGLTYSQVYALAIDPMTPAMVYAATYGGGVFAIQQTPGLVINYCSGAPGSFFTIDGSDFPPDSTATIAVNGNMLGTIHTDSSGG